MRMLGFVVALVLFVADAGPTHALSLSLQAAPPAITAIGQSVLVDVTVTGVKESDGGGTLRGYDLLIEFDPGVLSLESADITLNLAPFGGNPSVIVDSSVLGGDSANAALFVSVSILDDSELRDLQADAFSLVQLDFTSVSVPLQTTIAFGNTTLTGLDGFSDPMSGSRTFSASSLVLVPEPSVALLVLLGLLGLPAASRHRAG